MKKKIFVVMSIFTLVLASFTACEANGTNNNTDKITTTVAPTTSPTVAVTP